MSLHRIPATRPLAGPLPPRKPDGSYPFRGHRTCAQWMRGDATPASEVRL